MVSNTRSSTRSASTGAGSVRVVLVLAVVLVVVVVEAGGLVVAAEVDGGTTVAGAGVPPEPASPQPTSPADIPTIASATPSRRRAILPKDGIVRRVAG